MSEKKNRDLAIDKFKKIKSIGWHENTKTQNGHGGHGNTLESAFGVVENNKVEPDWKNFEIKSLKEKPEPISLTSTVPSYPEGADKYLWETYGEVKEDGYRRFYATLRATEEATKQYGNPWSLHYNKRFMKMRISKTDQRVYLIVQDLDNKEINELIYWEFDLLKNKFKKINDIIFATKTGERKNSLGKKEFKWEYANIFWGFNFESFLNEMYHGNIVFDFRCGVYKPSGKIHDRGNAFRLKPKDWVETCKRMYTEHEYVD
tara:strand:+ start:96 stop:878 length:783 start_codon:yes stop_codon:yes gene_type:complete